MVIADTNIIIDHLRQTKEQSLLFSYRNQYPQEVIAISVISVQELYEGTSTKQEDSEKILLATLNTLELLPYTYTIASVAGKLARDIKRRAELADMAIAATALVHKVELWTLNRKHFEGIDGLRIRMFEKNMV